MKFKIDERGRLYGFECEDDEKHVVIPDGVTTICSDVFRGDGIESVVMPDSVTAIRSYAFAECENLSQIIFSKNLSYVYENAFENTKWLGNQRGFVVINDTILYKYKGSEKEVVIPENIQYISDNAFSGNPYIESVVMSDNVTNVGSGLFSYCENLKSIRFSKNLKRINFGMFEECKSLTQINIPENIKMIGSYAFSGCCNLEKIKFPKNVIIESDSLDDTKWFADYDSDFVVINDILYKYKGKQQEITLPENIRIIGNKAFAKNQYIEKVVMPDSVTHIGYSDKTNSAFDNCVNLNEVILSQKLQYIGINAFSDCTSLKSISIPKSVTRIEEYAFYGCTALKNIEIHGKPEIMECVFINTALQYDWIILPEFDDFEISYNEEIKEYTFSFISENKSEIRKFNTAKPKKDEDVEVFRDDATDKCGVKNKNGDIIAEAEYEMIFPFVGGYAVIAQENWFDYEFYGIMDTMGEIIVPPDVEFIRPYFPDKIPAVTMNDEWGFISLTEEYRRDRFLVYPQFEAVSDCIQGHAAVEKDGKWGLIKVNLGKYY